MGVEILRLSGDESQVETWNEASRLGSLKFDSFHLTNPELNIWLMSTTPGARIFPSWNIAGNEEDFTNLQKLWAITNEQNLFDCLFLSHLCKFAKNNLYAIFSGSVRANGWNRLKDGDRSVYSKGQSCIYRLEGSFDGKLAINWVPFYSAQSMVRDPEFEHLWRLFTAAGTEGESNSLCLFSLPDPKKLPEVIQLLINKDDNRSLKLADMVDWFGMYTSPLQPRLGSCAVVYSKKPEVIAELEGSQEPFHKIILQTQDELFQDNRPRVAIRAVSRHVVL